MSPWTFETLAATDRKKLEEVVLGGTAPDFDQLERYIYCGWNHEWVGRLSGEKFKKGFRRRDGRALGYNEVCRQDRQGYRGKWQVKLKNGRPKHRLGYFRVAHIRDEPPQRLYSRYPHAGCFDYNVDLNTWHNLPFRVIRDIVVLPNPGDHSLLLARAYFQLGFPWLNVFYCYFLLGHRQEIEHEPW
jgi:hypothetical protein